MNVPFLADRSTLCQVCEMAYGRDFLDRPSHASADQGEPVLR